VIDIYIYMGGAGEGKPNMTVKISSKHSHSIPHVSDENPSAPAKCKTGNAPEVPKLHHAAAEKTWPYG
jgi:hypothetical protein